MSRADLPLPQVRGLAQTARKDLWWVQPALVFLGLSAFIVYATWAAFQGANFVYHGKGADYLSPFYSPLLFDVPGTTTGHAWFGPKPDWLPWPPWLTFSPALLILWAPGGFRFTCYYYRGAYYKAFWADPLSCAVGEPGFRGKKYRGEAKFPLILQNIHRYFMYLAVGFLFILAWDVYRAMWFTDASGKHWGIGLGTLILAGNPIFLGGYTLGCHSLRHIVGGRLNQLSRKPVQKKAWDCVSCLNKRHMIWAWMSLIWVAFSDVYVRMCASGHWSDLRIF